MRTTLLVLLLWGCDDGGGGKCVPGQSVKCPCPDGSDGYQVCLDSGRFGACQCVGGTTSNGGTTSGTTSGGTTSGGTTNGGTTTSGGGDAPIVLSLTSNVSTMTYYDTLIITAVVTHPGGISQIIGGKLSDPGGGTYGSFGVSTIAGSWSMTLTWSDIDTVAPVVSGAPRVFVAAFYDQAGHTTTQDLTVRMQIVCADPTQVVCGETCIDLTRDAKNCGACGISCSAVAPQLAGPQCVASRSRFRADGIAGDSCDSVCASSGLSCLSGAANVAKYNNGASQPIACGDVPPTFIGATNNMAKLLSIQCTCQ